MLGAVYHYVKLSFMCWWVAATGNMWWIIRRPGRARILFDNKSTVHAIESAVCLLVPGLLVGLVFAFDNKEYLAYESGAVCNPSGKVMGYFTFILPMQVAAFILLAFLVDVASGLGKVPILS